MSENKTDTDTPLSLLEYIATKDGQVLPAVRITSEVANEYGTEAQIAALYGAFAAASCSFGDVKKTANVNFTDKNGRPVKYDYAPMAELVRAVRKPLGEQGLAILQPMTITFEGSGEIRTRLVHKDGGRIEQIIHFSPMGDIKQMGGQTTYLARYAMSRLCLLDGVEDADAMPERVEHGAGAQKRPSTSRPRSAPPTRQSPPPQDATGERAQSIQPLADGPPTDEQLGVLRTLSKDLALTPAERVAMCKRVTGVEIGDLNAAFAHRLIEHMQGLVHQKGES